MIEYDLYNYMGGLFIVPGDPFTHWSSIVIDNVPNKYIIVRYEIGENGRAITGSDEIVFIYDKYSTCRAKINKLWAACKDSGIGYYMPELRMRN